MKNSRSLEVYEAVAMELDTKIERPVFIAVDEAETTESIIIKASVSEKEFTSSNYNYFTAYQEIRDKLLEAGLGMKCHGSRLNAVQSGMMAATDKIYLVEPGRAASMKDVVSLWGYADITDFPDTRQQFVFFEQWAQGLNTISS